jgi:hypothetical protein
VIEIGDDVGAAAGIAIKPYSAQVLVEAAADIENRELASRIAQGGGRLRFRA